MPHPSILPLLVCGLVSVSVWAASPTPIKVNVDTEGTDGNGTPKEKDTVKYEPNWESLDKRPIPTWFDDAKFGIFIHWGLFSVPAFAPDHSYAEWYLQQLLTNATVTVDFHQRVYGTDFTYPEFANMYHAELWDPKKWVELFQKGAGAKFVLFTSKHCDGWTHWKSPAKWNYNSVDSGPKRDVLGELTNATKESGMKMGIYYCNIEWGNPLLPWDYKKGPVPYHGEERYVNEVFQAELHDVVTKYQPDIINGDYSVLLNSSQLRSPDFLAWLYNDSPVKDTVVVNDRWGTDTLCKHGGYWTCGDDYNPNHLLPHKWVDEATIGTSWGLNRNEKALDYKNGTELIHLLIRNVALGGNLILNVGPASDGRIIPLQEERLRDIGDWLSINGAAIYNTSIYEHNQNFTDSIWFTRAKYWNWCYTIFFDWPASNNLTWTGPTPTPTSAFTLLGGNGTNLNFQVWDSYNMTAYLPPGGNVPHRAAWALQFQCI